MKCQACSNAAEHSIMIREGTVPANLKQVADDKSHVRIVPLCGECLSYVKFSLNLA